MSKPLFHSQLKLEIKKSELNPTPKQSVNTFPSLTKTMISYAYSLVFFNTISTMTKHQKCSGWHNNAIKKCGEPFWARHAIAPTRCYSMFMRIAMR